MVRQNVSNETKPHTWAMAAREALRLRRRQGMSLIEIMIVVIIMALIATAVGIAVLPQLKKAQVKTAKTDAQAIRSAVTLFIADNPGGQCPTVDGLVEGGYLDKSKNSKDPWDSGYVIQCEGGNIVVVSAGPDKQMGTEDDVQ